MVGVRELSHISSHTIIMHLPLHSDAGDINLIINWLIYGVTMASLELLASDIKKVFRQQITQRALHRMMFIDITIMASAVVSFPVLFMDN